MAEDKSTEDLFEEFAADVASSDADHSDKPNADIDPEKKAEPKAEPVAKKEDKPAEEEVAKKEEGDPEPKAEPAQADDMTAFLETLPEDQKAVFSAMVAEKADLEHKVKSLEGRVPGLQRKLSEYEKSKQEARITPDTFTKAFVSEESWKEFAEANPEISGPLQKFIEGLAENIATNMKTTEEGQEAIVQKLSAEEAAAEDAKIEAAHPGWVQKITEKGPDDKPIYTKDWNEWIAKQPPHIANIIDVGSTEDTIWLLDQFENHMKAKLPPVEEPAKADTKVADIKEKRDKQLKDGTTVPSTSGSATPISDENTESLFEHFVKQIKTG